jgi:arginine deiminase
MPRPAEGVHPPAGPRAHVDSEVGRLHTVILHRPGAELRRLTPRNSADLLFDDIPWVERAQAEHDAFAEALTVRGVEVLYLAELLCAVLDGEPARSELIDGVVDDRVLGPALSGVLRRHLADLPAAELVEAVVAGVARAELPGATGLVHRLMGDHDFVLPPLPNLLFTRDSSVWIDGAVAITSPSMPARRRESQLTRAIYRHHPRFAGCPVIYQPGEPGLEGGDVLLVAPGVVAVGVGQRTTPAGAETLARRLFDAHLTHTVLVVPIAQDRATMHLDTVCTMVDADAVVMYPAMTHLLAHPVTPDGEGGLRTAEPRPLLEAAAAAAGLPGIRVIDTGLDPVTAEREQWDDGNNTLALAPRVAVAYERNVVTNARLVEAGIDVVPIAGSELGSGRGGPRCMSCPVLRDSLPGQTAAS